MRRGLCTLYDQSPSALCLGNPVARDLHVVIGRTLAGSTRAVQSCLCSLSHINVARGLSAASCESLQWAIWVNHCSAHQSRDPDAAMPIRICESWLFCCWHFDHAIGWYVEFILISIRHWNRLQNLCNILVQLNVIWIIDYNFCFEYTCLQYL